MTSSVEPEDQDWDFILDLSAERIWFGCVYVTKMMMNHFDKYSKTQTGDGQCIFLRQLSCWHEKTLMPMVKKIKKNHDVPEIFRPVFSEDTDTFFSKGDACGLHMYLLLLTCQHLVLQCKFGLGPNTKKKVQQWFDVMKLVFDSSLFKKSSITLKTEFRRTFQEFNEVETIMIENEVEHEYFDPYLVFIHLSHLVIIYTKSSLDSSQSKHVKMELSKQDIDMWQTFSGKLFEKVFQLESHGLHILEEHNYPEKKFCYSVDFPYFSLGAELNEEKSLTDNDLPSVFLLLLEMFNRFESSIQKIQENAWKVQWNEEYHKLNEIFYVCNKLNHAARDFSYKREKA